MRIGVAADHAGVAYKEAIKGQLFVQGHEVLDFGTHSNARVDYPGIVRPVAHAVARGRLERGIVVGGSGNGEAIVANRVPGVRCALCWSVASARLARQHNDANMLALGQRLVPLRTALRIVRVWMNTSFLGGRHRRRILAIDAEARAARNRGVHDP